MCGGPAAHRVCARGAVAGWAFAVEAIAIPRALGYHVLEVPVTWSHCDDSRVRPRAYVETLTDVARIARDSGLNIIMGCSYYVEETYPADARIGERREEEIVDEIARDVLEGVDGTGLRAGIIGDAGCSWPLSDKERKVLGASGRAHRLAGARLRARPRTASAESRWPRALNATLNTYT